MRTTAAGWTAARAALAAGLLAAGAAAGDGPRPNIVFVLADDLGYGDVGCYGGRVPTPHIDGLAREGVRLTQFYSNGPECTPTRTALMTGRYQQRVGGLECALGTGNVGRYDDAIRLAAAHELGLPPSEDGLARRLRGAGYATVIAGKWHLGYEPKFLPSRHGFDRWFGPIGGAVDYFHHVEPGGLPGLYEDDRPVRREGYLTDLITDEALRAIAAAGDRPLFLYVAYTAPHTPIQGPEDRSDRPVPEDRWNQGTRESYGAMIRRMDDGVGRILAALAARQMETNTLVVFASDNGGTKMADNGPLKGTKGGLFEGGIRVPCVIRWPGVLPRGAPSAQVGITMDLTASMLRAAGAEPARGDGMDLVAKLAAGGPPEPRTLFWRARRGEVTWKAVRDGDLKYVARRGAAAAEEHLFDLAADTGESNDLSAARAEDLARLKRKLDDWEREVRPAR